MSLDGASLVLNTDILLRTKVGGVHAEDGLRLRLQDGLLDEVSGQVRFLVGIGVGSKDDGTSFVQEAHFSAFGAREGTDGTDGIGVPLLEN